MRWILAAAFLATMIPAANGHFIYLVPEAGHQSLKIVFSESLEPDDAVGVDKLSALRITIRSARTENALVAPKWSDHFGTVPLLAAGAQAAFATVDYGVMEREGKSFLLRYHAKSIFGAIDATNERYMSKAPIQIFPVISGATVKFRVTVNNKPASNVEVTVLPPKGDSSKVKTDEQGLTPEFSKLGRYGAWAKWVEPVMGEAAGKKYDEIRHYSTLVAETPVKIADASTIPDLPEAVSSFGAALLDGRIYVYGGHRGKTHKYSNESASPNLQRFKLGGTQWEKVDSGPSLQGLALVAHQGRLLRLGGMMSKNSPSESGEHHSVAECASFDPATGKWTALPDLPRGRSSHDAVIVNDRLIVIGGWHMDGESGNSWAEDVLTLNLNELKAGWKRVPQPFRRRALTVAVLGEMIYVVGGMDEEGSVERRVDVFDPKSNIWSQAPELPKPNRNGFAPGACAVGDRLIASPGDGNLYSLKSGDKAWTPIGKLQTPRIVHRMIADGDRVIVLGGAAQGGTTANVEVVAIPK